MDLGKYGVALHLYKPLIKRGSVDFAVSADWTPATGDVKISKDGGAAANVTNLPTAITMGNTAMWDFSLTATELQAAQVKVTVADSATKAVEDQFLEVATFGHASAKLVWDLSLANVVATVTDLPAAKLTAHAAGVLVLLVGSGSTPTTVKFALVDGGAPSGTNNFYNGRVIVFTSGVLAGSATAITDYDGATTTATVTTLTGSPANAVTGVIV